MEYRALGATGMQVSRVGFGGEHLEGMEYRDVEAVVHAALDAGINMMDCFMAEPHVRSNIGKALGRRRPEMQIQGHIGACWLGGNTSGAGISISVKRRFPICLPGWIPIIWMWG